MNDPYERPNLARVKDSVGFVARESKAMCSKRFIWMMTRDPQLDYDLGRLLLLFAVDMPITQGDYAHHGN